jgi:hypothetical protein
MGCTAPAPDVVARALDDGQSPSQKTNKDPGDTSAVKPPPAQACGGGPAAMMGVATKDGELHRFDLAKIGHLEGGPVKCAGPVISPIAIDRGGMIWLVADGTLAVADPGGACELRDLSINATAMTFVWDPKLETEVLYAVADGLLEAIHPATLARTPIGKLALPDVRSLAGTADGQLLAFAGDAPVTIATISRRDGLIESAWQVKPPNTEPFAGGVLTPLGIDLVFGVETFRHDPSKQTMESHVMMFPDDRGVLSIAAPPCGMWPTN